MKLTYITYILIIFCKFWQLRVLAKMSLSCPECTYNNPDDSQLCEMCTTPLYRNEQDANEQDANEQDAKEHTQEKACYECTKNSTCDRCIAKFWQREEYVLPQQDYLDEEPCNGKCDPPCSWCKVFAESKEPESKEQESKEQEKKREDDKCAECGNDLVGDACDYCAARSFMMDELRYALELNIVQRPRYDDQCTCDQCTRATINYKHAQEENWTCVRCQNENDGSVVWCDNCGTADGTRIASCNICDFPLDEDSTCKRCPQEFNILNYDSGESKTDKPQPTDLEITNILEKGQRCGPREKTEICLICCDEDNTDENPKVSSVCGNPNCVFHRECLKPNLKIGNFNCPTCRAVLWTPQQPETPPQQQENPPEQNN